MYVAIKMRTKLQKREVGSNVVRFPDPLAF